MHTWRPLYDPELADEEPSRVTWEIEPGEGGVCKLTTTHNQLERSPKTACVAITFGGSACPATDDVCKEGLPFAREGDCELPLSCSLSWPDSER